MNLIEHSIAGKWPEGSLQGTLEGHWKGLNHAHAQSFDRCEGLARVHVLSADQKETGLKRRDWDLPLPSMHTSMSSRPADANLWSVWRDQNEHRGKKPSRYACCTSYKQLYGKYARRITWYLKSLQRVNKGSTGVKNVLRKTRVANFMTNVRHHWWQVYFCIS